MKAILIPSLLLVLGLLASCDSDKEEQSRTPDEPAGPAGPKADPTSAAAPPEPPASVETNDIGAKLLGNTVRLESGVFKPADLRIAPEAFFVYYSASW